MNPDGLIITASAAEKYFGDDNPLGKVIRFKNQHDLHVTAVIADLPLNSHFSASVIIYGIRHWIGVQCKLSGGTPLYRVPAGACPREGGGGNDADCTIFRNTNIIIRRIFPCFVII